MKSRTFLLATAAIVAALSTSHIVYAAPTSIHTPVNAMFAKEKTVKLSLRNGSAATVEVRVGEELMSINAGQSVNLNVPVGTRIVVNSDTPAIKAGTLIAQVSKELGGSTVTLK